MLNHAAPGPIPDYNVDWKAFRDRELPTQALEPPADRLGPGMPDEPDASGERSVDTDAEEESTLILEDRLLKELPEAVLDSILQRPGLLKLSLKGNQLSTLSPRLNGLENLYYLNLSHNSFAEVPSAVCSLPGLEILDLSFNALTSLPDEVSKLQNLMVLSVIANSFEVLPPQIADIPRLVVLELDDNPIRVPSALPPADGDDEAWLIELRDYITTHRSELQRAIISQRQAAAVAAAAAVISESTEANGGGGLGGIPRLPTGPAGPAGPPGPLFEEGGESLRASKRMGFVMHRNAPGSSYVASLHARGTSHDARIAEGGSGETSPVDDLDRGSVGVAPLVQSPAGFAPPDGSAFVEHTTPRSPLLRSPRESPWGSPRPSISDAGEPQSSIGSRLSTLAEEHEKAESEDDRRVVRTRTASDTTTEGITPTSATQESDDFQLSNQLFKESFLGDKEFRPLSVAYEQIAFALSQVAQSIVPLSSLLPPDVGPQFANAMTLAEQGKSVAALRTCMTAMERLTAPLVFRSFVSKMERRGLRGLVSALLLAFPELEAAWRAVQEARAPALPTLDSSAVLGAGVDAQLHTQLEYAAKQAQTVLSLLNDAIARSAQDAASASEPATAMASRVRGLSESSLSCGAAARGVSDLLVRSSSARSRALSITERRRFWDEVNLFLKSIISMLGSVKEALDVVPLLTTSRIGPEVSNLARVAKEIPPLLEQSSYKVLLDDGEQPHTNDMTSAGGNQIVPAPPTPLTAAIGAAAQALISPSTHQGPNPFFEDASHSGNQRSGWR